MNIAVQPMLQDPAPEQMLPEQVTYIANLLQQYQRDLDNIDRDVAALHSISDRTHELLRVRGSKIVYTSAGQLKGLLLIEYWNRVYVRSQISQYLDSVKKKEWEQKMQVSPDNTEPFPEFTAANITSTLQEWYLQRENMFADRVDLVFQNLSKTHVTNAPEGFSKKMIFSYACEKESNATLSLSTYKRDLLHDLACCIALILNQPVPPRLSYNSTNYLQSGVKHAFYGDAFEIQLFKNGSMHLWVHPDIALELNIWLAKKYPMAIPTEFRVKTKAIKSYDYGYDPLSGEDVAYIQSIYDGRLWLYLKDHSEAVAARFEKFTGIPQDEILQACKHKLYHRYQELCKLLLRNGYPRIKDHQFYPTPPRIVEDLKNQLGDRVHSESLKVLEPSAGTGNLAGIFSNSFRIVDCVEVSPFFCQVLDVRGMNDIIHLDFLKHRSEKRYDLILMNPPYANKRLEQHLEHALSFLAEDGEIYLIAPTGKAHSVQAMAGDRSVTMLSSYDNQFEDTAISTALYHIS